MINMFKIMIITGLLVGSGVRASDDRLVLENLPTTEPGLLLTVACVSEDEFLLNMPRLMRAALERPQAKSEIIDYYNLFESTPSGPNRKYIYVSQGEYKILEKNGFAAHQFLGTSDLCPCVGVSIIWPQQRVGLMHVDMDSYWKTRKFAEFLKRFPENVRAECKVRLASSVWSLLFSIVDDLVAQGGFGEVEYDVPPVYWVQKENSLGRPIEYSSYIRNGMTSADIAHLNEQKKTTNIQVLQNKVNEYKAAMSIENPRGMLLNVETGVFYKFFAKGSVSDNGTALKKLNMFLNLGMTKFVL